jgi:hypothetical protein
MLFRLDLSMTAGNRTGCDIIWTGSNGRDDLIHADGWGTIVLAGLAQ